MCAHWGRRGGGGLSKGGGGGRTLFVFFVFLPLTQYKMLIFLFPFSLYSLPWLSQVIEPTIIKWNLVFIHLPGC